MPEQVDRELLRTLCELAQDNGWIGPTEALMVVGKNGKASRLYYNTRNLIAYATPARILALLDSMEPSKEADSSPSVPSVAQSIDTPEFRDLLSNYASSTFTGFDSQKLRVNLIAHIDAHSTRQAQAAPVCEIPADAPAAFAKRYSELCIENRRLKEGLAAAQASPATTAPVEQTQQSHVMPPFAAPAGQHDATAEVLTNDQILVIADENDYAEEDPKCIVRLCRAIEAEAIRRFRAQGGITNDEGANSASEVRATEPEVWESATDEAMQRACRDLPIGCEVRIELENGAGGVVWYDPSGNKHHIEGEGYLSYDINEAIDAALRTASPSQAPASGTVANQGEQS